MEDLLDEGVAILLVLSREYERNVRRIQSDDQQRCTHFELPIVLEFAAHHCPYVPAAVLIVVS